MRTLLGTDIGTWNTQGVLALGAGIVLALTSIIFSRDVLTEHR